MKRAILVSCAAALVAAVGTSWAKEAVPAAADPVLEKRAAQLAVELRCLVCQNQTIADSNADLAVDLRQQIREQIKAGKTNNEILDFMVERYGDFVLYRPPFKATTLLLWLGPFILLAATAAAFLRYLARRRRQLEQAELSEADRARAEALLAPDKERP